MVNLRLPATRTMIVFGFICVKTMANMETQRIFDALMVAHY